MLSMFNRTYRLNLTKLTLVLNKSMDDISKVDNIILVVLLMVVKSMDDISKVDNIILVVLLMIVKRKAPSKIRLIVRY